VTGMNAIDEIAMVRPGPNQAGDPQRHFRASNRRFTGAYNPMSARKRSH
jgi:hypothetical protein